MSRRQGWYPPSRAYWWRPALEDDDELFRLVLFGFDSGGAGGPASSLARGSDGPSSSISRGAGGPSKSFAAGANISDNSICRRRSDSSGGRSRELVAIRAISSVMTEGGLTIDGALEKVDDARNEHADRGTAVLHLVMRNDRTRSFLAPSYKDAQGLIAVLPPVSAPADAFAL